MNKNRDSAAILRKLKWRITHGAYYPGQKLSENKLAKEFDLSRTPIRETLKRLEHDDLVSVRPSSGTYVRLQTTREFIEICQVRAYLECLAYRLAIANENPSKVQRLEEILDEADGLMVAEHMDRKKFIKLHYRFHHGLMNLSGNRRLIRIFENLHLPESRTFSWDVPMENVRETQSDHHRIVAYLKRRDPRGEDFVKKHSWENVGFFVDKHAKER